MRSSLPSGESRLLHLKASSFSGPVESHIARHRSQHAPAAGAQQRPSCGNVPMLPSPSGPVAGMTRRAVRRRAVRPFCHEMTLVLGCSFRPNGARPELFETIYPSPVQPTAPRHVTCGAGRGSGTCCTGLLGTIREGAISCLARAHDRSGHW